MTGHAHPARTRSPVETGMVMMAVAMLVIPGIDAFAKLLGETVPPGEIVAFRFLFQSLFLLPVLLIGGFRRPDFRVLPVHAARGAMIALATAFFFTALQFLPMADAIAIFFVEPLVLTVISALFLGEGIGWRRVLAVVVGFGGALIVIRPGFYAVGWPALLPLGTALCFAIYLALTRRLSQAGDAVEMQFWAGIFGLLTMVVVLGLGSAAAVPALTPVVPVGMEWAMLLGLGVVATAGHMLVVHAFRRAPASVLAPFQYLEIIGATLLGWLIFGHFPDALRWLGVGIIVGSGLFVFHRERQAQSTQGN